MRHYTKLQKAMRNIEAQIFRKTDRGYRANENTVWDLRIEKCETKSSWTIGKSQAVIGQSWFVWRSLKEVSLHLQIIEQSQRSWRIWLLTWASHNHEILMWWLSTALLWRGSESCQCDMAKILDPQRLALSLHSSWSIPIERQSDWYTGSNLTLHILCQLLSSLPMDIPPHHP